METDISVQVNAIEAQINAVVQHLSEVTADVAKSQSFVNALQAALQQLKT
jgi:peptidoglycan hydrolase CwlO-like protein